MRIAPFGDTVQLDCRFWRPIRLPRGTNVNSVTTHLVSIEAIRKAAARIANVAVRTPLAQHQSELVLLSSSRRRNRHE